MGEIAQRFVRGAQGAAQRSQPLGDDYDALTDDQKEELCLSLLAEFGAQNVTPSTRAGEIVHSCCLPFGLHSGGDSHPSAAVNYKKLVYNCFSCGMGGSIIWFIAVCRNTSATEARSWLVNSGGVTDSGTSLAELLTFFDAVYGPKGRGPQVIPRYSVKLLDGWRYIHPYLTEIRGIPETTLLEFSVGWDPASDRIVIPHFWRGDLVGWQTRRLVNDGGPKYKSSTDFPKHSTVFNRCAGTEPVVVVESPMSVLSKHHVYPRIEATFGAEVPDQQCALLRSHERVVVFMDNDEAGWGATESLGKRLLPYTDVRVVENPYNADAADLDDETFLRLVRSPVPWDAWQRPRRLEQWPA